MSSEEPTEKRRSSAWYLLPIFLTIIGGVIAYFVIKEDDPKKAKNCLYLGIILTAVGVGFTVVSGVMLASQMEDSPFFDDDFEDSGYATPSEMSYSDESQINSLAEGVEYEYNVFGLKPNYIQILDEKGNHANRFDENSRYTVVSEIQNMDDIEKNVSYSITVRIEDGPDDEFDDMFQDDMHDQITIPANGKITIDNGGMILPKSAIYEIEFWLEDADTEQQLYEDLRSNPKAEYPQPFWRMFYLSE